ncbi:hypothetical protein [Sandarakinorhabdus sp. DWP1-3-1]|uniref:hypothetical protein n=1 Tax=Sandarakinorhabdus sp. DWP1-3-1 TaxID=2804627 RepID=UPI003CEC3F66
MFGCFRKSSKKITPAELKPLTYQEFLQIEGDYKMMCARAKETFADKEAALKEVLKLIGSISAGENKSCDFIVHRGNHPCICVAVVSMTEAKGVATLRYLLSDGIEKGSGVTMIGDVMSWSEKQGCGGKVRLVPDTDFLEKYYLKLGFVEVENNFLGKILELDPAKSNLWHKQKGRWTSVRDNI